MLDERPTPARTDQPASPATPHEVVVRVDAGRPRRRLGLGGVAGIVVVALIAAGGVAAWRGWLGLGDIFTAKTIDRSAPVLVEKLRDRSEFRGATGTFSATVDLEHTVGIVPRFVAGSRAVYSGVGTVDATVEFAGLAQSAVRSTDGALVVNLPHATLGAAQLDAAHSHVMNRDRGALDRLGGIFVDSPTSDHELERIARRRIESAAARSELRAKAERSTARMITDLARAMGVDHVDVRFGRRLSAASGPAGTEGGSRPGGRIRRRRGGRRPSRDRAGRS